MANYKGSVEIDTQLNDKKITQQFKGIEKSTQNLINKYNKQVDSIKSQELAIDSLKAKIETLQSYKDTNLITESESQRLIEYNSKLELMESKLGQTKDEATQTGKAIQKAFDGKKTNKLSSSVNDISKRMTDLTKRLTGMVKTVFVFNLLSSGMNAVKNNMLSLLKTNDQFNNNLNQIKANLMTAFTPIYNACLPAINSLMNLLAKLTGTISMFVSGLFGKSLKQSTSEAKKLSNALKKTNDSSSSSNGNLASLDKLEVIGSDSAGSAGSDTDINYDTEIQYSEKLLNMLNAIKDFISNNKEEIIGFLAGCAIGVGAIKIMDIINNLDEIPGLIKNIDSVLKVAGFGLVILGIISVIKSVIAYLNDPSWENFGKIISSIGLILLGFGLIIGNIPLIIAGVCILIVGLVVKYWDQIKNSIFNGLDWLEKSLTSWFGKAGTVIATFIRAVVSTIVGFFDSIFNGARNILDGIIKLFRGDFTGGLKQIFTGIKQIIISPLNALIDGLNVLIKGVNKISFDAPDWVPGFGGKKFGFNIPTIPHLAKGAVIPPRQEFAAILGDQKHGTNIETPLETMKDAFRQVLNEFKNMNSEEKEIVFRNFSIIAQFGNTKFGKLIIDEIRAYERETGTTLLVS